MTITVLTGDNRQVLKTLADNSVDAVVTDAPYGLGEAPTLAQLHDILTAWMAGGDWEPKRSGFMGATWDGFVPGPEVWIECLRVLKPGGHLLSFFGTRTVDMGGLAIRLAGFEVRDMIAWLYGSGFPKSHDVSKAIDARAQHGSARTEDIRRLTMGEEYEPSGRGRANYDHGGGSAMNGGAKKEPQTDKAIQWEGWGTALKPALEPIVLARKPVAGTVAANVLKHGTGALNIAASRIGAEVRPVMVRTDTVVAANAMSGVSTGATASGETTTLGRWPANVIHDGSEEVVGAFPATASGVLASHHKKSGAGLGGSGTFAIRDRTGEGGDFGGDSGSASRFFYSAKADSDDRVTTCSVCDRKWIGVRPCRCPHPTEARELAPTKGHPTTKPVDLKAWLVRLVTPPGGVVLDPFAGSGTTGMACQREGFDCILIEREAGYVADINHRLAHVGGGDLPLFAMPDARRASKGGR